MSCPDCFRGEAATGTPTGSTKLLHGFNTYIASPPNPSPSTIILYTDAFGHLLPNNKLLADALAAATNIQVLVPDIIPGGGMSPSILPLMDSFSSSSSSVFTKVWSVGKAMYHVVPFFMRASPQSEKCTTPCFVYAQAVKKELPVDAKLGIAGYCWGGFQALYIARQLSVDCEEEGNLVDAVFVAHPAKFESTHVVEVVGNGARVSFAHAGEDMSLPIQKIEETKKALDGNEMFELKVYEGCAHGFAVRAIPGKKREADAADEAFKQAVEWFGKWL